jgi:LysR family pca operon transcriptional activator
MAATSAPPAATSANVAEPALHRIRLRHLQCAAAIAATGSLRAAAQALSVTQPAVTKTLTELEALLGLRLFERGRLGAQPTPGAADFLRHARASLSALQTAVDSACGATPPSPVVRLGVLPTVAAAMLPPVLRQLGAVWPQATVQVSTGRNAALLVQLHRLEVDLVIGRLAEPEAMAGLSFELLHAEPLSASVRPGHPLLDPAVAAIALPGAALGACPWVLPPAGTVIRHAADSFLGAHGAAPRAGVLETLSGALAREWVLSSDAVWFAPLSAVQAEWRRGGLCRLDLDMAGTEEPVGLFCHSGEPALEGLVGWLAEAFRRESAARRLQLAQ